MSESDRPSLDAVWSTISVGAMNPAYAGQADNEVRTTRYRWWTFVPLTLFEQYRVLTNFYFLIVLVISFLPWSPVDWPYQLAPMVLVLVVSMVKSGIEDLIKHAEDRRRNGSPSQVFRCGSWATIRGADLRVGDILRITEDSMVPADVLFVGSDNEHGLCYFSEATLNGETAVKTIQSHCAFDSRSALDQLTDREWSVAVGAPNRDLTRFHARLQSGNDFWPVSISNMLLRGVTTVLTKNVIGIVICTGHDTKIMQNIHPPPAKLTAFDHRLNQMLIIVFVFKLCLVLVCTFLGVAFDTGRDFRLLGDLYPGYGTSWLEYFAQYFILYSYMFPVSLTVTIEFIRLFHAVVIYNDPAIFDSEFGTAAARNSNVICQLGVVSHVLSDKTGTLTENLMELRKFVTDGVTHTKGGKAQIPMLLAMAICNTVAVLEKDGKIEHHAESPDEAAFVAFAARHQIDLVFRSQVKMGVEIRGRRIEYDILAMLPFDSDRKRQSILVRASGGPAILYCKGADSVISQRSVDFNCEDSVAALANEGLRTLVFARREVPDEELNHWLERHRAAEAALNDRDRLVAESAAELEVGLSVLGVTGIEDRLQCEVPETIKWLRGAGISVWVLTGDKLETAIAVGRMSGVIMEDSDLLKIVGGQSETVGDCFASFANQNWTNPVLIVTGDVLEYAITDHLESFLNLADRCTGVILARSRHSMN
jgi:phospholipid-transporting ATPase